MKRKTYKWAVVDKFGPILKTFSYWKNMSTRYAKELFGKSWKKLYKKGYRCRKVKISWEE